MVHPLRSATWCALSVCSLLALSTACEPEPVLLESNGATVVVTREPFDVRIETVDGRTVLALAHGADAYTGVAATQDLFFEEPQLLPGWDGYIANEKKWRGSMRAERIVRRDARTLEVALVGGEKDQLASSLVIHLDGARVTLDVKAAATGKGAQVDKLSLAFKLDDGDRESAADDEAFFGLGERYTRINHRGQSLFAWAEEGGLGAGEDAPARDRGDAGGEANPFPNGPSMTYFPVPFFLSSRGFGMHLDTTRRSEVHLGSERSDAWRVAVNGTELRATVYVHDDPLRSIRDYTADTGRPPIPAPWVFGPRRRVGSGSTVNGVDEIRVLRDLHVPTTGVDDAVHFLPHLSHVGREEELRAWTTRAHALGYKVMAYNNPYVSQSEPAAAADYAYGVEHELFLKDESGAPGFTFFVSGTGQTLATIDLTNPEAVEWFQSLLTRTLDLGYDGWMHDFGEYVARSWTAFDGSTGEELHNRFPVLSAQAAFELLERTRPNDYLFFVRSGYAGSQAFVPAVWSGDPESTFDETQGVPSQLRAGVNLGASGVPYWGTDTSGFKCLTDAPRDKDVYLRWAQLAALTPIMMEQNACSNPIDPGQTKWTLYSDDETTRVYADMARLHTRLLPYFLMLAHEAHDTGAPLLRHAFLVHPDIAEARAIDDAFYLGDRVYVMPVVRRGQTQRTGWLPPGSWLDVTELPSARARVEGGGTVTVDAPLTKLPWFLKAGTILPMLDERVETLAPDTSGDVVSWQDARDQLTALVFLGGARTASITLTDGTVLSVARTTATSTRDDTSLAVVDDAAVAACSQCVARTQPAGSLVALHAHARDSIVARGFALTVEGNSRNVEWIIVE